MGKVSRFPFPPLEEAEIELTDIRVRTWMQTVWEIINCMSMPQPVTLALDPSPAVLQYIGAGASSIFLSGGTVSLVEFSRDGTTWLAAGNATDTSYLVNQGDYLRITYASAPTVTSVPR